MDMLCGGGGGVPNSNRSSDLSGPQASDNYQTQQAVGMYRHNVQCLRYMPGHHRWADDVSKWPPFDHLVSLQSHLNMCA